MIPQMERRLAAFVDRANEMDQFCEMLETREKPIMVVWGGAGLGKTSLFYRMMHECGQRNLRKAEVVWSDTRSHTYLDIMRKIRDDVGAEFFKGFNELLNSYENASLNVKIDVGTTGEISVGENMVVEGSKINDVAGAIIKDSTFVFAGNQMAQRAGLERDRMAVLTDRFIQDLAQALKTESLVVFFDAVEKMKDDCYKWVWSELLRAAIDGKLGNVSFVLCGRARPQLEDDMRLMVEQAELQPLGKAHILEYFTRRRDAEKLTDVISDDQLKELADFLSISSEGRPLEIANQVDTYLRMKKRSARE